MASENINPRNPIRTHPTPYILSPLSGHHKQTLILLHGTSTTGHTFGEALMEYKFNPSPTTASKTSERKTLQELLPDTKFVFPSGVSRKVTVLGGKVGNAWFDIHDFSDRTIGESFQKEAIIESGLYLRSLIISENHLLAQSLNQTPNQTLGKSGKGKEKKEKKVKKVILVAFSQGSAIGGLGVLSGAFDGLIDDFVGASGWLPFCKEVRGFVKMGRNWSGLERGEMCKRKGIIANYIREDILGLDGDENEEDEEDDEDGDGDRGDEGEGGEGEEGDGGMRVWLVHGVEDEKVRLEWGRAMKSVFGGCGWVVRGMEIEGLGHVMDDERVLRAVVGVCEGREGGEWKGWKEEVLALKAPLGV